MVLNLAIIYEHCSNMENVLYYKQKIKLHYYALYYNYSHAEIYEYGQ